MTNLGYTPGEPIAAIATSLAPAAIGIVRTSGEGCIGLVSKIFSNPKKLISSPPNSLVYGWILDGTKKIDQVMLGVYHAPKSFTGEDMVEIYCHGGVAVVKSVMELLLHSGFRQAEKGEFTFRAFINGKTDLTRAEAVREIIDSKTDESRNRAIGRLQGILFEEINSIKKLIVDSIAQIEVEIEYPEDEENISDTFDDSLLREAESRLEVLVSSWKNEKLYQDGYLNQAKAAYEGLPEGYSQDGISAAERLEVLDRYQGFMKLCGQWHSSGTGNRIETRETYSSGRYYYWYQEPGAYSGSVSITCQIQEDGKVKISGTAEFRRYTNYDDNANRLKTDTKTISFSETSASIPYTIKQGGMTLTWNGNGFSLYYQLKDKSKSYATYTYTCQYRFDNRSSAY